MDMRIALLFSLCASAAGLSVATKSQTTFIAQPHVVQLQDITALNESGMVPVELKDFPPMTVMTYAKGDRYISHFLQKNKAWDTPAITDLIDAYKKHGSKGNLLDVGGNIGSFTMPLANALKKSNPDSVVVTVEASPMNLEHLKAGIKFNKLDNVKLFPYAIGDSEMPDSLTFKQSSWNKGKNQVLGSSRGQKGTEADLAYSVSVPATTLDSIMDQAPAMKKIFAMKMDIEGYEYFAMTGAKRMFTENPPCVVYVELTHTQPNKFVAKNFLAEHGYTKTKNDQQNGWYEQTDMAKCVARL